MVYGGVKSSSIRWKGSSGNCRPDMAVDTGASLANSITNRSRFFWSRSMSSAVMLFDSDDVDDDDERGSE